ncbi:MAG: NAD(P)H-dependent glycerol-3-phosphate dehydrogenase [Dehalococcoidia bacterium]
MGKILILGAGVMGTALSVPLCQNKHGVNLWGTEFDAEVLETLARTRQHIRLDIPLPDDVTLFSAGELEKACQNVDIVVLAVTSSAIRSVTRKLVPFVKDGMIIVNAAKGLEEDPRTGNVLTMLDVIESELPQARRGKNSTVTIAGPSIAKGVAEHVPTEVVFASRDLTAARHCQKLFSTPVYKVQISTDVIGVGLCAGLKNVFAVAMGLCDGVESKADARAKMDNSKAALLLEAVAELSKIIQAMGGMKETASGLAGIGDLYVTVLGGRTSMFGQMIGSGISPEQALAEMRSRHLTIEAYPATASAYKLAQMLSKSGKLDINDLPLLTQIYAVLFNGKSAQAAISDCFAALR